MSHRVDTLAALEALYAEPAAASLAKESDRINAPYRRLIEAAPFFAIASHGPRGLDVSPRGDGPGFVRVLDEHTLAFPDRRGNNPIDTLRNIVHHPGVALLFLIPGLEMTLRVNGRAHISTDPALLESLGAAGVRPVTAVVVELETLFFQCARALKRARLWHGDARRDPSTLPSAGELIQSVAADFDGEGYDAQLEQRQRDTLY